MGAMTIPVVPVKSSQIMFEMKEHPVNGNEITYRWFRLEAGNKIHVGFWCNRSVQTYIFTEDQFEDYATNGNEESLKSIGLVETGKMEKTVKASGLYFFVVHNPGDDPAEVIFVQGTGSTTVRVTVAEKIREYWFESALNDLLPFSRMIRKEPGVGSFA
jgi:hypothetical protein